MATSRRLDRIEGALRAAFAPVSLSIEDESSRHAGHAGARPGGETHFRISMCAAAFSGEGRVQRQRRVYQALDGEFASGLHALSLSLRSPDDPPS